MSAGARVTAVLVDLAERRQVVQVHVTTKRFIALLPLTIGALAFDRTGETTAEGWPIFRQAEPPRPSLGAGSVEAADVNGG